MASARGERRFSVAVAVLFALLFALPIAMTSAESDGAIETLEDQGQPMQLSTSWFETAHKHTISIEIPGVERSELKLQTVGDLVCVSGERKKLPVPEDNDSEFLCLPPPAGAFSRTFELDSDAKLDELNASLINGILLITIPKVHEKVISLD